MYVVMCCVWYIIKPYNVISVNSFIFDSEGNVISKILQTPTNWTASLVQWGISSYTVNKGVS